MAAAAKRFEIKAEGGWVLVNPELSVNHYPSQQPYPAMHNRGDGAIPAMAKVAAGIHIANCVARGW